MTGRCIRTTSVQSHSCRSTPNITKAMLYMALWYSLAYIPHAILTKALSSAPSLDESRHAARILGQVRAAAVCRTVPRGGVMPISGMPAAQLLRHGARLDAPGRARCLVLQALIRDAAATRVDIDRRSRVRGCRLTVRVRPVTTSRHQRLDTSVLRSSRERRGGGPCAEPVHRITSR